MLYGIMQCTLLCIIPCIIQLCLLLYYAPLCYNEFISMLYVTREGSRMVGYSVFDTNGTDQTFPKQTR